MEDIPGYIAYYFVDVGEAGGRMVSISVFESEAGTAESSRRAAEWVWTHPGLFPPAKAAEVGSVVISVTKAATAGRLAGRAASRPK
jgi:hypothetical protein